MLEQLQAIPWSSLKHAYGSANDVPDQIRALASSSPRDRERALHSLYGNIFHQGTRYQATPHAVPFLYELIERPEVQARHSIVHLLVSLALGYEEGYLPGGLDAASFRRLRSEEASRLTPADLDACRQYGFGPQIELDCYDAVLRGVPSLLRLAGAEDAELRQAAAYALAWFPEQAEPAMRLLRRTLDGAADELELANALLALGLLSRNSGAGRPPEAAERFLGHASPVVRISAAIAGSAAPLGETALQILLEALLSPAEPRQSGQSLRFNDGNLIGYVGLVLASNGQATRARVLPALGKALRGTNALQSLDITQALLSLVMAGKPSTLQAAGPGMFDELELEALRDIAIHGGWKTGDAIFVNYGQLVRAYGLPDSQEALLAYLAASSA